MAVTIAPFDEVLAVAPKQVLFAAAYLKGTRCKIQGEIKRTPPEEYVWGYWWSEYIDNVGYRGKAPEEIVQIRLTKITVLGVCCRYGNIQWKRSGPPLGFIPEAVINHVRELVNR